MSPRALLLGTVGFAIFILSWHLATLGNQIGDLPGPAMTVRGLVQIAGEGVLWENVVASVFRVAWGFCLAAGIGIPLGMAFGWYPRLRETFNPLVQSLRPISPIAWLPFAVILFGGIRMSSDLAAIFLLFLSAFFPIVTASTSAVASLDLKYIRSARNFGVDGLAFFRRVVLPASLPQILTGLRLALGIAWVVVVAAEMLGVESGLGYQVMDSRNALRMDFVSAAMVVIAAIGLMLDMAMARVEATALARRGMSRR
ncbi:ABC transporter permease [Engelhardtia mirabilis]|uniref:Bicarbonate transport system permease protein CmpB n=1 Tax=Engelhardtia mirabilis TaxID=2528011 RepID=A0A518BHA9_9BACT|nr:Bicarbonate transport system permease protein CmpB [Planctomycetes bacterium Pla133]QDV00694.1 Bicarbonate transport system permease protein CmpB [Planctomycetes bacterium Pla86]